MRQLASALVLVLVTSPPVLAQEAGTTVTVTISPTYLHFDDFGGGFRAGVARVGISRDFSRAVGGEVAAFALAAFGGASAEPDCVPGAACVRRATPGAFSGVLVAAYTNAGDDLRVTGGVGGVFASGGDGFEHRSSPAGIAGLDWIPRRANRVAPTVTMRVALLARPVGFTRFLLLPGVGVSF